MAQMPPHTFTRLIKQPTMELLTYAISTKVLPYVWVWVDPEMVVSIDPLYLVHHLLGHVDRYGVLSMSLAQVETKCAGV